MNHCRTCKYWAVCMEWVAVAGAVASIAAMLLADSWWLLGFMGLCAVWNALMAVAWAMEQEKYYQ